MFSILKKHSIKHNFLIQQIKKRIHLDFDPTKDYYKILGVDSKSTDKQIKEQYYKLAKKHHPDLNNGVSSDYFKEMTAAYEILSDSDKRRKYDQLRSYSSGGFWNTTNNNANQQQGQGGFAGQNYSNFNSSNYYNTSRNSQNGSYGKQFKMWQFTYVDPKTGQKRTFNFNEDAFKNFDDFISKMRSEVKTDFGKSESFRAHEERSKRDFFGNKYYEQNKTYYQNSNMNTNRTNTNPNEEFSKKFQEFDFNFKLFNKLNMFLLFGSVFMFFSVLAMSRRRQDPYVYYEQVNPGSPYGNPYQNMNAYQDPYIQQQPFKPINYRLNEDPYTSNLPPRYR